MPDRSHIIIPGDVTLNFATSEGFTDDAARLVALVRTARSRLIIATTSPDVSQYRQTLTWIQPGLCIVIRTAITPDDDIETHIYQTDNEGTPRVTTVVSPLTPSPVVFDELPILPTAVVYAAQQDMTQQAAQLLGNYSFCDPSDSASAQVLVVQRWAYATQIWGERTKKGSFAPISALSTFITPATAYRIKAPLFAPSTGPHIPIYPIYSA